MFSSDNGGPTQETTSSNGALNGVKGTVLEGGIRVPTLVQWSGRIEGGRTIDTLAMGFDLTATALAAAGLPTAGLDGVDLMPWLTGARVGDAHEALFWRAAGQGAVRAGDWKLVKNGETYHLFDLASDPGERTDLAKARPDMLAGLKARYDAWSGAMAEPLWIRNEKSDTNPRAARDRSRASPAIEAFIRGERPQISAGD
jgi:arylsulfatase A-like enzyme